jgi:importin-9
LSKLYDLNDPRIAEIQVKGDIIMPKSDRIMTRSRAKEQPDTYTAVSAQLKIIKVLVEELLSASGNRALDAAAAGVDGAADDDEEDDEEWEDDPEEFLDLGAGMTKSQLMAFGADDSPAATRGRDDETQAYLLNFFRQAAQKPGFGEVFNSLTAEGTYTNGQEGDSNHVDAAWSFTLPERISLFLRHADPFAHYF